MQAHPPSYQPHNPHEDSTKDDDRFQYETQSSWNDVIWLVLFVVHLVVMVGLAATFGPDLLNKVREDSSAGSSDTSNLEQNLSTIIGIVAVGAFGGVLAAALWMAVAKRYADSIIKLSLGVSIAMNVFFALVALAQGSGIGLFFLLMAGLTALYFYWIRNRIRFAAVMLELSVNVIQEYTGPVYVAFAFVALEFAWVVFWAFTFVAVLDSRESSRRQSSSEQGDDNNLTAFLLLISLYWSAEVLKNIVHVTTAGVAATWWFFAEPRSPTCASLKRATTTSLGSICFGSLIVAVISALRAILNSSRRDGERGLAQECLSCIVSCVENLVQFFNVYAFSRIAIYGDSFIKSGKDTFELFKSRGFDLLVNDDLTGTVLAIGAMVGFAVSGGIGAAWAAASRLNDVALYAVLSGIIGYLMVFLVMNVLRSCVATFFITWAEEPAALQQTRPLLFSKLSDAVHQCYPNLRSGF